MERRLILKSNYKLLYLGFSSDIRLRLGKLINKFIVFSRLLAIFVIGFFIKMEV